MIDESTIAELAEEFDREAKASYELGRRYDYDLELKTQYDSTGRAYRNCANRLWALVGS